VFRNRDNERFDHIKICTRLDLDNTPLPSGCRWKGSTWIEAKKLTPNKAVDVWKVHASGMSKKLTRSMNFGFHNSPSSPGGQVFNTPRVLLRMFERSVVPSAFVARTSPEDPGKLRAGDGEGIILHRALAPPRRRPQYQATPP